MSREQDLEAALRAILAHAVTEHGSEFPGCRGCDAVIEAKRALGEPVSRPHPNWKVPLRSFLPSRP